VPPYFFKSYGDIVGGLRNCSPKLWRGGFGSFEATSELYKFLEPYFNCPISVKYQVLKGDIGPHTDVCEQQFKYNYIYDLGGDSVTTKWWDLDTKAEVFSIECKLETWYKLNVKEFHSVEGTFRPRLSITIKEIDVAQ